MADTEPKPRPFDASRYCDRHLNQGYNAYMGFRYVAHGEDWIELSLPIRDELHGPDGAVSHAAVISLLDMTGTVSVWVKAATWWPHATLDLRVDWLADFSPEEQLFGHARCDTIKDDVAFVFGHARDATGRRLAQFVATYMKTNG
jgi:acyl-coenzyme A thioesterase PaaI-like protein